MRPQAVLLILALGAICLALAWAASRLGPTLASPPEATQTADAGISPDARVAVEAERLDEEGEIIAAPSRDAYACLQPRLDIHQDEACARGEPYPACRWELPAEEASGGLYRVWRNTTPEHRFARPGLVSLVLAAAREYAERWPGEQLTIGDLDAPGPRHQTHNRGVDVDLYLPHAMLDRNEEGRAPFDNYHGLSRSQIQLNRDRVMDLGKLLATCSHGRLRIYYADRPVVDAFRAWFPEQGFVNDVSPQAMQMHNALHRFHYHMTVADDLAPLELAP